MMTKYYAERNDPKNLDRNLTSLKYGFKRIWLQMNKTDYFSYAYEAFWLPDIHLFFFTKLGFWNIWPIEDRIEKYSEEKLFSII